MLFAYTRGLGFSFSGCWKLYRADSDATTTAGRNDAPTNLLCLRDVAMAGLLPDLSDATLSWATRRTYTPTPGPLDYGNGWWNNMAKVCDYWTQPKKTTYEMLIIGAMGGAAGALFLNWLLTEMRLRDQGINPFPEQDTLRL
ncbi:hypothetical protein ACHAWF_012240 [Thalassiosira exigua]